MIARGPLSSRVVSGLLLALLVTGWIGTPGVRAVEPPGLGPLDRPLVDVALVEPGDGLDPAFSVDAGHRWVSAGFGQDRAPRSGDRLVTGGGGNGRAPWGRGGDALACRPRLWPLRDPLDLPRRGPDRLASAGRPFGRRADVELGRITRLALAVDDAGAIDVDGDGYELLVASATTTRGGGTCQTPRSGC